MSCRSVQVSRSEGLECDRNGDYHLPKGIYYKKNVKESGREGKMSGMRVNALVGEGRTMIEGVKRKRGGHFVGFVSASLIGF